MSPLVVELETVTPLFLGGADPKNGPPELRVPSIRGALRYWLRALLGGAMEDSDLTLLKTAEDAVFGSTEAGASAIILGVQHNDLRVQTYRKRRAHRDQQGHYKPEGMDYLFWSLGEIGSEEHGNWQPGRQYVEPGTRVLLKMKPRLGIEDAEDRLRQAGAALWLLVQLGGLGARSRRGAGSLIARQVSGGQDLLEFGPASSASELQAQLKNGLTKAHALIPRSVHSSRPSSFDVLARDLCRCWVIAGRQPWKSYRDALDGIGAQMIEFRGYRLPDHDTVRDWMEQAKTPPTVERAAFGLPLPFRYSKGGPSDVVQGKEHDRRSSPLWLHVTKLSNGQYIGVATLFKSAFLAPGEPIQLQRRQRTTLPPPDYSLVEQFVEKFPTHLEVAL